MRDASQKSSGTIHIVTKSSRGERKGVSAYWNDALTPYCHIAPFISPVCPSVHRKKYSSFFPQWAVDTVDEFKGLCCKK